MWQRYDKGREGIGGGQQKAQVNERQREAGSSFFSKKFLIGFWASVAPNQHACNKRTPETNWPERRNGYGPERREQDLFEASQLPQQHVGRLFGKWLSITSCCCNRNSINTSAFTVRWCYRKNNMNDKVHKQSNRNMHSLPYLQIVLRWKENVNVFLINYLPHVCV